MLVTLASPRRSPYTGEAITAPHQGLLSIAATLRAGTFHPSTRDVKVEVYDDQLVWLCDSSALPGDFLKITVPDILGVQAVTSGISNALDLIARARAKNAGLLGVLGGVGPTQEARRLVSSGAVDVVVRGEGEFVFSALVDSLLKRGRAGLIEVPGITFVGDDGEVVETAAPPLIDDLNRLPTPARDLADMKSYQRISRGRAGNLITSRGCGFSCAYCYSRHHWGIGQRRFSLDRILKEIETLVFDYGFNRVRIEDDDFLESPEWVSLFCEEIKRRNLHKRMEWEAKARPDHATPDRLLQLRSSGCFRLLMGVETLNNKILRRLSRPIAVDLTERALQMMNHAGIGVQATLILGIPGETDSDMRLTLSWLEERLTGARDIISPCFFVPFSRAVANSVRRRFDFTVEETNLDKYTGHLPITSSPACSIEELQLLYQDLSPTRRGIYPRTAHLAPLPEVLGRLLPAGSDAIAP